MTYATRPNLRESGRTNETMLRELGEKVRNSFHREKIMSTESSVACPNCGVMLPTTGLPPGVTVQCASCGKQFALGSTPTVEPSTSAKAVTSLVLGLIPVPVITGIPAVILGIWALLDIKRMAGQLRGSGMAICGIIFGSLCSLLCGPAVGAIFWFARTTSFTDKPDEIQAITASVAQFDLPDGVTPLFGMNMGMIGMKMIAYGDRQANPSTMIMLMKFPASMVMDQKQMEQQMRGQMRGQQMGIQIERTQTVTYTIRGQPVQVTESFGKEMNSRRDARQYIAMIAGDGGPLMIMMMTAEPRKDDDQMPGTEDTGVHLTEEQVKQFFESIK